MKANLKLEKFQGPLDLLLQLIDKEELDITDVALAEVTEQYFEHLNSLDENKSTEMADFLVVATRLVYLKSRHLLPYLMPEDVEEGPSLAEQLKLYKKYAEASKFLASLWERQVLSYQRIEPPQAVEGFVLPHNALPEDLQQAMQLLIKRLEPINPLPEVAMDKTISLKQRVSGIWESLKRWKEVTFVKIMGGSKNKTDLVVNFLAVLELAKQEKVAIRQESAFGEMIIRKT
jgi:segregation and condensation protein A